MKTSEIVDLLRSAGEDDRHRALGALDEIRKQETLPAEEIKALVIAAAGVYPEVQPGYRPATTELLQALTNHAASIVPDDLLHIYSRLDDEARAWTIRLLAEAGTEAAAIALGNVLHRVSELPDVHWPPLIPLKREPRFPELLIPALIAAHASPHFSSEALITLISYAEEFELGQYEAVAAELARKGAERAILEFSIAANPDDAQNAQSMAGAYLDLLTSAGGAGADDLLRIAANHPSTWIAMWGVVGLERLGQDALQYQLEHVAADPVCRLDLYNLLDRTGRIDRFPDKYRTQALLAESNMVQWLMYPTELDAAPDEIELLRVDRLNLPEGPADLFVFRFRVFPPHWAAKDGWLIGIAGPYLEVDQPTSRDQGLTFSRLEPESSISLDEHVRLILGECDD